MEFERTECDSCVVDERYLKQKDEYYKIIEINELKEKLNEDKKAFNSGIILEGILAAAIYYFASTKMALGYILASGLFAYGLYHIKSIKKSHKDIKEDEEDIEAAMIEYDKIHNR